MSSTEGVYVAATKARPATEEPVKRTAAKPPAGAVKRTAAKSANGSATKTATKAAKAPAKAAEAPKARTATKGADAKSGPARGRPKKASADDAEVTTADVDTVEEL